jgi:hypothetical protein
MKYELLDTNDLIYLSKKYFLFNLDLRPLLVEELINYECKSNMNVITNYNGEHWTALFIKNNICVFFDPFGIIYDVEISQFINNRKISYINKQIQKMNQSCCGYYCLYFLYYMNNKYNNNINYTKNMFISLWSEDESTNDNILQTEIKKLL